MSRLWVPECLQTSVMDCGPAALSSLLLGAGVDVDYEALRVACDTTTDGTSIDALERVAAARMERAEQVIVPAEHVCARGAQNLPCVVVVTQPDATKHFVTLWSAWGGWVQVMDPAVGRTFCRVDTLRRRFHRHTVSLPVERWRRWAQTREFLDPLAGRLRALGVRSGRARTWLAQAVSDPGCASLAGLDAAVRLVESLAATGEVQHSALSRIVESLWRRAAAEFGVHGGPTAVPRRLWSVWPEEGAPERLSVSGAVLLRVSVPRKARAVAQGPRTRQRTPRRYPGLSALMRELRGTGFGKALAGTALAAATVAVVELTIVRSLVEVMVDAPRVGTPWALFAGLLFFVCTMLALEWSTMSLLLRGGRRLETTLRGKLFARLWTLPSRYVLSRTSADLAERAHSMHAVRSYPTTAARTAAALAQLLATVAAMGWLEPRALPAILGTVALSLSLPLLMFYLLRDMQLRVKVASGALARFYLDAALGLRTVKAHAAELAVRREHEARLVGWYRAARTAGNTTVLLDGLQAVLSFALVCSTVWLHILGGGEMTGNLLLVFWALNLPNITSELVSGLSMLAAFDGLTSRVTEPLAEAESQEPRMPPQEHSEKAVEFRNVELWASGRKVLGSVNLSMHAGEHVAIIGASGAGKSSLLALLLGTHTPTSGEVRVGGVTLGPESMASVRASLSWIDPSVYLFNDSLLRNLLYASHERAEVDDGLDRASLHSSVVRLPQGLGTPLGEGGGLLSGGEGQRVRVARALLDERHGPVLLDEPFRGLDRAMRTTLLRRVRERSRMRTLLCVTHDVHEALSFDRVIVVQGGRVVEDGNPNVLARRPGSATHALLSAERDVEHELWNGPRWRHLMLGQGKLHERSERSHGRA